MFEEEIEEFEAYFLRKRGGGGSRERERSEKERFSNVCILKHLHIAETLN